MSNGVWIYSSKVVIDKATSDAGNWHATASFYVFFCVIGSLLSQWIAIKFLEKRFKR